MGSELKGYMSLPGQDLRKYVVLDLFVYLFVIIAAAVCPWSLSWLEEKSESLGMGITT